MDPEQTTLPDAMMAMRSPSTSASSMWCVVTSTVRRPRSPCTTSHTHRRDSGSRPLLGSSRITTWSRNKARLKGVHVAKLDRYICVISLDFGYSACQYECACSSLGVCMRVRNVCLLSHSSVIIHCIVLLFTEKSPCM